MLNLSWWHTEEPGEGCWPVTLVCGLVDHLGGLEWFSLFTEHHHLYGIIFIRSISCRESRCHVIVASTDSSRLPFHSSPLFRETRCMAWRAVVPSGSHRVLPLITLGGLEEQGFCVPVNVQLFQAACISKVTRIPTLQESHSIWLVVLFAAVCPFSVPRN